MASSSSSSQWSPIAKVYSALRAGSIDGTDTVPHDHGVVRAMLAKYKPNQQVTGVSRRTLFVGRLSPDTNEDAIRECFERHGKVANVRLVKDIVTGASKRYAFVEYERSSDAAYAAKRLNKSNLDNREIFVDFECERDLAGWIPRRLGGGFGGKKEAGQLRFGGLDRPFRKPIAIRNPHLDGSSSGGVGGRRSGQGPGRDYERHGSRSSHRRYEDRPSGHDDRQRDRSDRERSERSHGTDRRYRDDQEH